MSCRTAYRLPVVVLSFIALLAIAAYSQSQPKPPTTPAPPTKEAAKEDLTADKPSEAEEFALQKRVPPGERSLPMDRYWKARQDANGLRRYSTALGSFITEQSGLSSAELNALGNWSPLGPGNIGGRTRALVIAPSNPNLMYAAGVAGGVWKSTDAGNTWTALGDVLPNLAVSTLAVDPVNAGVIYAGTGEGFYNSDAQRGAGIFKSTDGGLSWGQIATPFDRFSFYYTNKIVISPNDHQRIYVGTRTGIWLSRDGGTTWEASYATSLFGGCLDMAIRTDRNTDYLFASIGTFTHAQIFLNPDAAGSGFWGPVSQPELFGVGRMSIAIAPSNQNVIYAIASEYYDPFVDPTPPGPFQYGLHAVYRSIDGGMTWTTQVNNTSTTKLNTVLLSNPVYDFLVECNLGSGNVLLNQGWYDNVIAVDPADPNRVWVGGVDLFRSDDGGLSWGLASYWWADPADPHYAHADHHAIVFHPQYNGSTNRVMFVANDGGIFRTDNARASVAGGPFAPCNPVNTGVTWTVLNNNYGVSQFYHGLPYPDNSGYFGGTQDNGTLRGTDAAGTNAWTRILGGDGGYVAINPTNTSVLYAENTGLSIKKSTNGGATFLSAVSGITENPNNFLFISPFTMDPSNPQRLWAGGRHLWRTTNGAAQWVQATDAMYTFNPYSCIAEARTDANYLAAGSSDGYVISTKVALTADATQSFIWTQRTMRSGFVSSVTYDPTNANILYATYSSFNVVNTDHHVYRSLDGGVNWRPIDGTAPYNLPDIPVHCLVVDPATTSHLYVGTDLGVFVSLDWGETWARENSGFVDVITESLSINSAAGVNTLYAFTHGRGAWRVTVPGNCASLSAATQSFTAAGGLGIVNVTAAGGCAWTATTSENWIAILAGSAGSGNGTVRFAVATNTTLPQPAPRVGVVKIAGQIFLVRQDGDNCVVSLSPASQYLSASSGSSMVEAFANGGCSLSAVSNDSWITITSPPTSTNGYLQVTYNYTANPTSAIRTGSIKVSGPFSSNTLTIRQAGQGCSYTVSPTGITADGTVITTGSIQVTASAGCSWTAVTSDNWITINSGGGGTGNGTVNYTIARNNTPDFRGGHIIVAGYDIFVQDNPGSCTDYTVSPTTFNFDQYGGTGYIDVTTASYCQWGASANTNWITINSPTTLGSGRAVFTVAKNETGVPRTATINMPFQTVTVNQVGNGCLMALAPSSGYFPSPGGSGSVTVTGPSGCSWSAVSNDGWITVTSGFSGSGQGVVGYQVGNNLTGSERTGSVTIAGVSFSVSQQPGPPTAIRLENFSAATYDTGVLLEWRTGYEVSNLGFRVYKEAGGARQPLNTELVAGSALTVGSTPFESGKRYSWWDQSPASEGTRYWLEDIDLNGTSTWHGPITVKVVGGKPPARSAVALLPGLGAKQPLTHGGRPLTDRPAPAPAQYVTQQNLAAGAALKLAIKDEGWYRVRSSELQAAGFTAGDTRFLQLYAEGVEVPILINAAASKDGKDGGEYAVEFYATGLDTISTDTRVYWLIAGQQPGKRIQVSKESVTGMGARSFDYTVERRERSVYFSALRNGEAENFFGRVITAQPVEEELAVSHLDGTSARTALLEVALQGVTTLPGPADHSVEVRLNGQALGRISYDGQQHATEKFNVPLSLLRAGDNAVTLVALNGASDISLVDYLRLTYPHTFDAEADGLRCVVGLTQGPAQALGGFGDASVRVIDMTNPAEVEEIGGRVQAVKGGYQITIGVAGPNRELLAFTDAQVKRPAGIQLDRPSSLHQAQEGADLLIVSRHELVPALAPLVQLRQQQGLAVKLVDIEDIYDEFSFGEKSPQALRDFLSYSQGHWTRPARYVLLAGKGSYDPRNYLGYGDTDLVPARLVDTGYLEAASDDWFVDFNDDGMADLSIGRLPVLTPDEVALLVRKLTAYEQAGSLNQALLVADANEGYDFEQASTALLPLLGDLQVTQVNRARLSDEQARKIVLEELNQGPKLVNYLGHGSADGWHGGTLSGADAAGLTNWQRPSVFVLMTCLNGYYDAAGSSLAEALLKAGPGGAMAVWASTGMSLPVEQARVNREFYRQALASTPAKGNVIRLGDVARRAKAATTDLDVRRTWVLLGDPTATLH